MKIDKTIQIKYSYAGINQYAKVYLENDVIVKTDFNPSYAKREEVPSLEGKTTIEEILETIKGFAYCGRAEIHSINGDSVHYYNRQDIKKDIEEHSLIIQNLLEIEVLKFFTKNIVPLLDEKNWKVSRSWMGVPVLIYKNDEGNWDNVDDERYEYFINEICGDFLRSANLFEGDFKILFRYICDEKLKEIGIFVEL